MKSRRKHTLPCANSRRMHRAFTLIEIAIVVSITSLLFALAATTIVALLRVERRCAEDAATAQSLSRLAARSRADVHAAVAADCDRGCRLSLDDGRTVYYEVASPVVVREVRQGDDVIHRDSFQLARHAEATFSLEVVGQQQLVRLKVAYQPAATAGQASAHPVEAVAALNLHGTTSAGRNVP